MIKLKNVSKYYDNLKIFENFNLDFKDNKITCILGKSGVGKTTLLNMISGITGYEGIILKEGRISYIFQEPRLLPNKTVRENLLFTSPNLDDTQIEEMLAVLKLNDRIATLASKLSGGEAQRVSIARAFLYEPDIILMDEPFSSLDIKLKYELISYFSKIWNNTKRTAILVTHDIDEALLLADNILILENGVITRSFEIDSPLPRGIGENDKIRNEILSYLLEKAV